MDDPREPRTLQDVSQSKNNQQLGPLLNQRMWDDNKKYHGVLTYPSQHAKQRDAPPKHYQTLDMEEPILPESLIAELVSTFHLILVLLNKHKDWIYLALLF